MKKKILALTLTAVMTAMSLAGCGNNASSATPDATDTTPDATDTTSDTVDTSEENTATVSVDTKNIEGLTYTLQKDPTEYKMYCYWPGPDTFFDSYVLEGLKAFESDYGVTIDYGIGTEWTQDIENQMVEAKMAEGKKLFYIFGADTTGANGLYKEIYENGGKVVNYAGLMNDPQESAATLASDTYQQAYNSTKQLISLMGEKGKIINVLEQLSDVNTQKRQQGVEDAVAEYPDVEIVQTVADISTADQGYEKVSDAIAANAGINGIIATAGTASIGLANALNDYYGTNPDAEHIYAASMDQSKEVMSAIDKGYLDYTVAQSGWAMGYVSALILCMMDDGYEPVEFGGFIDTGMIFINKDNATTWQEDIEKAAADLIGTLETTWLKK